MSEDARRTLTIGAVIGRHFDLSLVEATGSVEGDDLLDALEEAERAQLITTLESGRDIRYRFAHELIRQTLIDNLSLPRRQRLHLRLADAIETVGGRAAEKQASTLAHHLYQAGAAADAEKTVRFLTLAGEQAITKAAFEEALQYFDNALAIEEDDDSPRAADLRDQRGVALRSLGRADEAIAEWRRALTAYQARGDDAGVVRVAERLSRALGWRAQFDESEQVARQALGALSADNPSGRGRFLAAIALGRSARADRASFGLIDEAVRIAEEAGDPEPLAFVLSMQTFQRWNWMRCADGIESGRRAIDAQRALNASWQLAETMGLMCYLLQWAGRFDEAADLADELRSLAARLGHQEGAWFEEQSSVPLQAIRNGDLVAAEACATAAVERAERANIGWVGPSYRYVAMVRVWQGRWGEAQEPIARALEKDVAGSFVTGTSVGQCFWVHAHLGTPARELLRDPRLPLPERGQPNTLGSWSALAYVTEGLALLGARAEAAAHYQRLTEVFATSARVTIHGALWEMLAGIAAACGDQWDVARKHYETALTEAHEMPNQIAQPDVRRWYARMLIDRNAAGDRDKARTLLGEATIMYRVIGMPKHVEMAEGMLAKL